jgi:hypothetical protein
MAKTKKFYHLLRQAVHRMNTSIHANVAAYLSIFQMTNAKGQESKLTRLLKDWLKKKYMHPLEKASIYIHIFK